MTTTTTRRPRRAHWAGATDAHLRTIRDAYAATSPEVARLVTAELDRRSQARAHIASLR